LTSYPCLSCIMSPCCKSSPGSSQTDKIIEPDGSATRYWLTVWSSFVFVTETFSKTIKWTLTPFIYGRMSATFVHFSVLMVGGLVISPAFFFFFFFSVVERTGKLLTSFLYHCQLFRPRTMDWLLKKSTTVKVNFKLKVVSVESLEGDSTDVCVVWKRGNKKARAKIYYIKYCWRTDVNSAFNFSIGR